MNPLRKNMTRKCSSCGVPAPDGESRFCNRCGAAIVDEPEQVFPVCASCGAQVADPGAQFCDKCGGPVRKTNACPTCGNPAIDENSKFCTRCGTTFAKPGTCASCGFVNPPEAGFCNRCGASLKAAGATAPAPAASPSVILTKKRVPLPIPEEQPVAADWDPWSDESPESAPQETAPQVRMPQKKYGHLPLVADELKDYKKPSAGMEEFPAPARPVQKKKGNVLNFMKK
jgi:hypothetical protein